MSPALMEAYLSAAGKISRLAMASNTAPTFAEFNVPDDATQNYHVEGLPFGTRGGTLIDHEFPADGEYVFKIVPIFEGNMGQANDPFGQIQGERLSVTIDGKQVQLFDWDKEMVGAPRSGVPTPRHSRAGRPAPESASRSSPTTTLPTTTSTRSSCARRSKPATFPGMCSSRTWRKS